MPIPIEDYQSRSASSELAKAGLASLWFAGGTQLGFKGIDHIGRGLLKTGWGATRLAVNNPGTRFAARSTIRAAGMYAPHIRDIAGGGVKAGWKTASWLYRNPVAVGLPMMAAAGFGMAMVDPSERISRDVYASPSIVESMGGTSNYGTRQMMDMMNADGSMVFGMNARR